MNPIRQHVDVVLAHVAHDLQDLFVGFTKTDHQTTFRRNARREFLEAFQQIQRVRIVGARARFLVQPGRSLEVVVHHIRWRGLQDIERTVHAAPKIGREDFDLRLR
jgi:hypothetical protein